MGFFLTQLNIKYFRFKISPSQDINLGAILVNSKKTRTFTIENCGNYEFKYLVAKYVPHAEVEAQAKEKQATQPAALRRGYSRTVQF